MVLYFRARLTEWLERGRNHANKVNAGFLRAGGSRVNFRYGSPLTAADLRPDQFLSLMSRVLDVSAIRQEVAEQQSRCHSERSEESALSPEYKQIPRDRRERPALGMTPACKELCGTAH